MARSADALEGEIARYLATGDCDSWGQSGPAENMFDADYVVHEATATAGFSPQGQVRSTDRRDGRVRNVAAGSRGATILGESGASGASAGRVTIPVE